MRQVPVIAWAVACLATTPAWAQDGAADAQPEDDELEPAVSGKALDEAAGPRPERAAARPAATDELDLGRTEITGNQELPKVLYIVPWRKSDPGNLLGRPVNTLLDEVLAPLDREEFIRQVDYYSDLEELQDE